MLLSGRRPRQRRSDGEGQFGLVAVQRFQPGLHQDVRAVVAHGDGGFRMRAVENDAGAVEADAGVGVGHGQPGRQAGGLQQGFHDGALKIDNGGKPAAVG